MQVCRRICVKKWEVTAQNGDHFELKRGEDYLTSCRTVSGVVIVLNKYWVDVPSHYFGGPVTLDGVPLPDDW